MPDGGAVPPLALRQPGGTTQEGARGCTGRAEGDGAARTRGLGRTIGRAAHKRFDMIYRIGNVTDPREDDPRIDGLDAAIAAALDMSDADALDSYVIAVWEDDGYGYIAAVCYQSGVYRP